VTQNSSGPERSVTNEVMVMNKCFLCFEPSLPGYSPPACQRHHDFSLLLAVTRRTGYEINVENLTINFERLRFTPAFTSEEIPALLQEVIPVQLTFEFGCGTP
jgi:hypothetical protein